MVESSLILGRSATRVWLRTGTGKQKEIHWLLFFLLQLHPSILGSVLLSLDQGCRTVPQPQTTQTRALKNAHTHTLTHLLITCSWNLQISVCAAQTNGRKQAYLGPALKSKVDPLISLWLRLYFFFFHTPAVKSLFPPIGKNPCYIFIPLKANKTGNKIRTDSCMHP